MTVELDGIERRIFTINPETLEFEVYVCGGYFNTSRFPSDPKGKLVDWYRPTSGKGKYHSLEYLELLHKKENRPYEVRVKGQEDAW